MKALLSKNSGGPETLVLEDIPEPIPGPGEVRIAVRACGVNFPDLLIIQDLYQDKPPRPFAPGAEVAPRRGPITNRERARAGRAGG
jgi:NADPH2:quinone reductase